MDLDISMLTDFRLVALHGGFGRASRSTGRPKATLSKRVIELETNLGVRLFDRSSRSLHLTEEGQKLLVYAQQLVDTVESIREELGAGAGHPSGKLRIAAPSVFSQIWLGRVTAEFIKLYPEVEIEAFVLDPPADTAVELFDVLIRVNPPPSMELVGRVCARDHARVVTSPSMIDFLERQLAESDEPVLPAIAPTGMTSVGPWTLDYKGRSCRVQPQIRLHLPSRVMMRDAVRAGFGFAELPATVVMGDLDLGHLVDLGPAPVPDVAECRPQIVATSSAPRSPDSRFDVCAKGCGRPRSQVIPQRCAKGSRRSRAVVAGEIRVAHEDRVFRAVKVAPPDVYSPDLVRRCP
ncbi:LysR family transcriptional regulator [Sphingomonas sp.]|uniref:LysR family transcriptional regulator n=1 Tax=Sphingomonas sp. TaxID=28214 RepID=UPI00345B8D89